ncbi:TraI/MobA(P) family conjugative relaxase [Geomonas azotofigens]|uniref:TraI/MobA(P) family conjugative relaxase n=1 Tax=Geomonas azotofigens TaxID=2843196 RepID=UPI001C10640E|nr:TraI/MobA(P) family conjugative relaxase [Geomonas azotofigens]MBU5612643.1 relaxase/mobilization nuclease domain-containing protein [Geomonas azotofigens]
MIAKKVRMRSVGRSDYDGLVKYLTDKQGKYQRLGYVSVSNCHSQEWQAAVIEVLNTQSRNTRALSDKTYHLIVSLRAGEEPGGAILKAIEERICYELGYSEHQRICVVHHDTDNLHFHIAINKIHPTRHTIHDPYYDHVTLGKLCEKLERQHGLAADNHQVLRNGSESRAADMERHAGVQSLLGWIQRECAEQMQQAESWAELHALMAEKGLQLQERGNGLVITDGTGLGVKAGSVARHFSKPRLEKRLGSFKQADRLKDVIQAPPQTQNILRNPSQLERVATGGLRYRGQPMPSRYDTAKLYGSYQEEQQEARTARAAERAKIADRRKSLTEAAKRRAKLKRAAAKAVRVNGAVKRILYGAISNTLQEEIRRINRQCTADRLAVDSKYPWRPWADWLRAKAVEGDREALAALRAREAATGLKGDTITGKGHRKHAPLAAERDCITKKGTIIYHVGTIAVRDDGDRLQVSRGANMEGLQAALLLASEHYGSCIAVNGTGAFKEQVARAAAAGRLPITFDDAALERHRQELLGPGVLREKASGHDNQAGARTASGRPGVDGGFDNRGAGSHGCAAAAIHPRGTTRGTTAERGAARHCKPYVGGVGRKPPPQGQNRLRELSELGVVHLAGGGQVLLPRDVPDRLERQGAKPDHRVRRGVPRPGEMTAGQAAAVKYVAEREAMRLKASGVPKHRLYDHEDGSSAAFAGTRKVEGEFLALLKRGDEILVLPVGAGIAQRLKRVPVGDTVTVTANGSVTRARGRKI